jgi:hypothetical protein
MDITVIAAHAVFFGFLTAWLAERKKYGAAPWFALGVLLGAVAPFLLFLQPDRGLPAHAPAPSAR